MAHLHFKSTPYKSGGVSATARVAYITRQPVQELDRAEQQLRYLGIHEGPQQREDVVMTTSHNLPAWADGKAHTYFAAAERHEGVNRVAFTEWKVSLPRELSHRQNLDVARDVLQMSFGDSHPYCAAFHDPPAADGEKQPHLHVLWSARTIDGVDRTEEQFFKRWNAKHPERGGAQKDPAFSHMGAVFASRQLISDVVNLHLQHHGHAARVDPRSLEDRGIDRQPEMKLRPSDSYKLKHQYELTPDMATVMQQRHQREGSRGAEEVQARYAWDIRKVSLGITPGMEMPQALDRVREAREQAVQHKPVYISIQRTLSPHEQALTTELGRLERYHKQLTTEIAMEQLYAKTGQTRSLAGRQHVEQLLAEGKAHGIPEPVQSRQPQRTPARNLDAMMDLEETQGAGLRVRLREREEEHDRGMSW